MLTILVILLVVLLLGSGPWYPYSRDWGYGPSGALTVILVIIIAYLLLGGHTIR